VACAAVLAFHRSGRSLAEAGAFGLAATTLAFAACVQINRATGLTWPGLVVQTLGAVAGTGVIWGQKAGFPRIWDGVVSFARGFPLPFAAVAVAWAMRAWAATSGARLIGHPLAVKAVATQPSVALAVASPLVAMGPTDDCLALFAFMAYGTIGLATYALSRRHAWPPTAVTAVLVVVSMPRLAHPQLHSAGETIMAAVAIVVLVAVYRALEQPRIDDLLAILMGIALIWSNRPLGWVLPAILAALALMMLVRRHGAAHLGHMIGSHRWWVAAALVVGLLVSPALTGTNDVFVRADGPSVTANDHGLSGAPDNLARALVMAAGLGLPQNPGARAIGLRWQTALEGFYARQLAPLTQKQDGREGLGLGGRYGFGPLALLVVLPAIGYALAVGPRRLRALATALAGYFYLIVLIPAWEGTTVCLLTPLMVLSGAIVAFFLPPWRLTRTGRRGLQLVCLLLLVFGLMP